MEDPNLLAVSNVEAFARSERLDQLAIAADNLVALIAAAKVLAQLG